jgi:hypothetical protein
VFRNELFQIPDRGVKKGMDFPSRIHNTDLVKIIFVKGIVSPDWKGLQMVSLDRFEV